MPRTKTAGVRGKTKLSSKSSLPAKEYLCPTCQKPSTAPAISAAAYFCPHCAAPLKHQRQKNPVAIGFIHSYVIDESRLPKEPEIPPEVREASMYEEVENNLTKDERISVERLRVEHRVQNGGSWSEHQPDYIVRYQDYYGEVRLFCQECGGFLQNFAFGGGRSEVTPRCRANMHGRTCNTITRFVFISGGPAR